MHNSGDISLHKSTNAFCPDKRQLESLVIKNRAKDEASERTTTSRHPLINCAEIRELFEDVSSKLRRAESLSCKAESSEALQDDIHLSDENGKRKRRRKKKEDSTDAASTSSEISTAQIPAETDLGILPLIFSLALSLSLSLSPTLLLPIYSPLLPPSPPPFCPVLCPSFFLSSLDSVANVMVGFGDADQPLQESVDLMERMVMEYVRELMQDVLDIAEAKHSPKLLGLHFLYALRKDKRKCSLAMKKFKDYDKVMNSLREAKMSAAGGVR
ncbi:hypothetical protein AAMO2058_001182500 [Amorphochlora amoebiformis]